MLYLAFLVRLDEKCLSFESLSNSILTMPLIYCLHTALSRNVNQHTKEFGKNIIPGFTDAKSVVHRGENDFLEVMAS